MSGEGPESIPTSADPRSKRPTKKRALSPSSAQAASLEALFAKPDQEIRIPVSSIAKRRVTGTAPEIVTNVQGSSAGAGSGEFHVYKAARRREYERLRIMDEEVKAERAADEFNDSKAARDARDEERTRRNREKRDKKKNRGKKASTKPTSVSSTAIARREVTGGPTDDGGDMGIERDVGVGATDDKMEGKGAEGKLGIVIHDDD